VKPLRLAAQLYGPFETLDVDFPLGAVAVIGPNGAGKSTLVNAIDRALFGSRTMGDWLSTGEDDGAMSLTLEFEHAGQLYRVRRGFSAKGRGKPSLDFEVWEENGDARS
jgi:DNA repair exonuclease SbcCD ATPase subunit